MFDPQVRRISEHVYAMKAGAPDRPSLCAIVGASRTLMLDSGASDAHARLFLDGLTAHGVRLPDYVALTHWHWDHVFGAAEIAAPVIACRDTARGIAAMQPLAWDDAALAARVASGEEIAFCADNIVLELPEPRRVRLRAPEIIFDNTLTLDLGGLTCTIQHVGGDHARDACVMHVPADGLLFLGDCLYDDIYAPTRHYTAARTLPLLAVLERFDAHVYIQGHAPEPQSRADFEAQLAVMRSAARLCAAHDGDLEAVRAAQPEALTDEMLAYYLTAFAAGWHIEDQRGA